RSRAVVACASNSCSARRPVANRSDPVLPRRPSVERGAGAASSQQTGEQDVSTPGERGRESDLRNQMIRRWECVRFLEINDRRCARVISELSSGDVCMLDIDIGDLQGENALLYVIEN